MLISLTRSIWKVIKLDFKQTTDVYVYKRKLFLTLFLILGRVAFSTMLSVLCTVPTGTYGFRWGAKKPDCKRSPCR